MTTLWRVLCVALCCLGLAGCADKPEDIPVKHVRAIAAGDVDEAMQYLAPSFQVAEIKEIIRSASQEAVNNKSAQEEARSFKLVSYSTSGQVFRGTYEETIHRPGKQPRKVQITYELYKFEKEGWRIVRFKSL